MTFVGILSGKKTWSSELRLEMCFKVTNFRFRIKKKAPLDHRCRVLSSRVSDSTYKICSRKPWSSKFRSLDHPQAVHFEFWAPQFFPDRNSQWKAPQFHAMRTPSCRKTDQLRLSFRKTSSKLKSWKLSINRKIPPELNPWNAVSPGVLHQRCAKWRLLVFCPAKNHGARN